MPDIRSDDRGGRRIVGAGDRATTFTISSPYAITDQVAWTPFQMGLACAWAVQPSADSTNRTWTVVNAAELAATKSAFVLSLGTGR